MSGAKKSDVWPVTVHPNDLIAALPTLRIDSDNVFEGQSNSKFNNIIMTLPAKGRMKEAKPKVDFYGLRTFSNVRPHKGVVSANASGKTSFTRDGRDKANIAVRADSVYTMTKSGEPQKFGEAMMQFGNRVKDEVISECKKGKSLGHGVNKWYFPYKDDFEDKDNGITNDEGITTYPRKKRDVPIIQMTMQFEADGKPKFKVGDFNKRPLRMKLPEEDGGQWVEFNADTVHHFLRRDSDISGVVDATSMSRTAQGKGVTAKIKELYIVPGTKSSSNLDEDEMAQWAAEKAREQAERESEESGEQDTNIPIPTYTQHTESQQSQQPSLTNLGGMMLNFKPVGGGPATPNDGN